MFPVFLVNVFQIPVFIMVLYVDQINRKLSRIEMQCAVTEKWEGPTMRGKIIQTREYINLKGRTKLYK
jgi:hypothetical protein